MAKNYYQKRKENIEFSLWCEYTKYNDKALIDILSSRKSIERFTAAQELQLRGAEKKLLR